MNEKPLNPETVLEHAKKSVQDAVEQVEKTLAILHDLVKHNPNALQAIAEYAEYVAKRSSETLEKLEYNFQEAANEHAAYARLAYKIRNELPSKSSTKNQ